MDKYQLEIYCKNGQVIYRTYNDVLARGLYFNKVGGRQILSFTQVNGNGSHRITIPFDDDMSFNIYRNEL